MPTQKTCTVCGRTYYVSRQNRMRLYVGPCCRGTPNAAEVKRKGLPGATDKPKQKKSVKNKKPKALYHVMNTVAISDGKR